MTKTVAHWACLMIWLIVLTGVGLAQEETATQEPEAGPQVLTIWWPDTLLPITDVTANALIEAQTQAFMDENPNVEVIVRRRSVGALGGILSTLRTANVVAPDAIPEMTLVKRQDLIALEQIGLAQSLEGRFMTAITADLDGALQLGQIDTELRGLPYILELTHLVYRPINAQDYDEWTYEALLARNQTFNLPADAQNGLNSILQLQYLAGGGTLNADGLLTYNDAALRELLQFYQDAADAQLLDANVLNYRTSAAYLDAFLAGDLDAGVFSSSMYLSQVQDNPQIRIAPIPTASGEPASLLDGWMWVLTTTDVQLQDIALNYVNWMMMPSRLNAYAEEVAMLPALRSALNAIDISATTRNSYLTLIDNATMTPSSSGTVARAIQEAVSDVLTLEQTAQDAAQIVADQLQE